MEGIRHIGNFLDSVIISTNHWVLSLLIKLVFPLLQVFLFQKTALYRCNMAGKPAVLTRVVDSMTNNLRPTRAEATDVANAVLDGASLIIT